MEEFRQILADIGRKIQRESGATERNVDFRLEIIANDAGKVFLEGSVQAPIAITSNVQIGILAVEEVIRLIGVLDRDDGVPDPNIPLDRTVLRRLARIATVQKRDKVELEISVQRPGFPEPLRATFGDAGIASIKALQAPTFAVEAVSVFGKLVELIDRDQSDEDGGGFWGELRDETGDTWRKQFKPSDIEQVATLFRKQVVVSGTAVYYRVAPPKIVPDHISQDSGRDYEAAFDELFGCDRAAFHTDTNTLIQRMRED